MLYIALILLLIKYPNLRSNSLNALISGKSLLGTGSASAPYSVDASMARYNYIVHGVT